MSLFKKQSSSFLARHVTRTVIVSWFVVSCTSHPHSFFVVPFTWRFPLRLAVLPNKATLQVMSPTEVAPTFFQREQAELRLTIQARTLSLTPMDSEVDDALIV